MVAYKIRIVIIIVLLAVISYFTYCSYKYEVRYAEMMAIIEVRKQEIRERFYEMQDDLDSRINAIIEYHLKVKEFNENNPSSESKTFIRYPEQSKAFYKECGDEVQAAYETIWKFGVENLYVEEYYGEITLYPDWEFPPRILYYIYVFDQSKSGIEEETYYEKLADNWYLYEGYR